MAGNEVVLTFAGDASSFVEAAQEVDSGLESIADQAAETAESFDDTGESFDDLGGKFDTVAEKARGFRNVVRGATDATQGFSAVLSGDLSAQSLSQAGMGVARLAAGLSDTLIPAMRSAVAWLGRTRLGMMAATAAQWAWNIAVGANPIGLIIIAIAALIAIIVVLVLKWDTVKEAAGKAWDWIKEKAVDFWDWLKSLPEKIGAAFHSLPDFITRPFRTAFNFVADAWNNTIGKLSWTVPSWVPFIGGNTISAPQLPRFHTGISRVPRDTLAWLQAGERVVPASSGGATGQPLQVNLYLDSRMIGHALVNPLAGAIAARGGRVTTVLNRR